MAINQDANLLISEAYDARDYVSFCELLRQNPDNVRSEKGNDLWLHRAATDGLFEFVRFLVDEMGIQADEMRPQMAPTTPAQLALSNGHRDIAFWLLERSSQLNQEFQGKPGCMILHTAVMRDDLDLVKWLIEHGVDANANFGSKSNALMDAKSQKMEEYLRSVGGIELPTNIEPPDYVGGHEEIIEFLDEFCDADGYWGRILDWTTQFTGSPLIKMHCLAPGDDHNQKLLFTVGMSDVELQVQHDTGIGLELALALPPDWPLGEGKASDLPYDAPMTMLHDLARQILASGGQNFLYEETDGPEWSLEVNSDIPAPVLPGVSFCGYLLLPIDGLTLSDDRGVCIYHSVPLYMEEIEFVRQRKHFQPLLLRFVELDIQRVLDFNRPNAVADWPEGKPEPEIDDSCSL